MYFANSSLIKTSFRLAAIGCSGGTSNEMIVLNSDSVRILRVFARRGPASNLPERLANGVGTDAFQEARIRTNPDVKAAARRV